MKTFRWETWSYALLLIILFTIASIAVHEIVTYIEDLVSADRHVMVISLILSLTLGFMLIAGAFGLWAIQFAGESESRRRIGMLVNTMDYLSDGLIVMDRKGRITGSNPAAKLFANSELDQREKLQDVFGYFSHGELNTLLDTSEPVEIEKTVQKDNHFQTLRFRFQPSSEGFIALIISDVTSMNIRRQRNRQIARLQITGQIARGVADDFSNILFGISGHAAVLQRLPPGAPETAESIRSIQDAAEKGISLAEHLNELARPEISYGEPSNETAELIKDAAEQLRDVVPAGWQINVETGEIPPVALTGLQIGQLVSNIGIIAADAAGQPGKLRIIADTPDPASALTAAEQKFACVILVTISTADIRTEQYRHIEVEQHQGGVILSVLRSMLDETGGILDYFMDKENILIYRVLVPGESQPLPTYNPQDMPDQLRNLMQGWTVIFGTSEKYAKQAELFRQAGNIKVEHLTDIVSILSKFESYPEIDIIVLDAHLMKPEPEGLIRAVLKLKPSTGIVIIGERLGKLAGKMAGQVAFVESGVDTGRLIMAMIDAKSFANKRRNRTRS